MREQIYLWKNIRERVACRVPAKIALLTISAAVACTGTILFAGHQPAAPKTAQLQSPQRPSQDVSLQDRLERFEVVSIRRSVPGQNVPPGARGGGVSNGAGACKGRAPQISPGRIVLNDNALYTLVTWAYGLTCEKAKAFALVSGGEEWILRDQWVIQATIPEAAGVGVSPPKPTLIPGPIADPKLQKMLQNLLADRFKLVLHREMRQIPVYNLTVAKGGPKLQEHPEDICKVLMPGVPSPPPKLGDKPSCTLAFRQASMTDLAAALVGLDRPVVDKTGIAGTFDFRLLYAIDQIGRAHV